MFESYIKQAKLNVLDKFNKSKQFINLNDIVGFADLDLGYKAYLTAEVNWWIYEEQMVRKTHLNFNLEQTEIAALLQELDNLYFINARFDIPGFKTVVDSAVKIRLNMSIRPRTTLKWFVFRGEPTKTYNEILLRLDYLGDNRYIIDEFIRRVEQNKMIRSDNDIFSVIEFEKIIEQIDDEKIYELSPEGFVELTNPIFEFFNFANEEISDIGAPTEAFIIFLDDKQLTPLSKKLEGKFYNEDLKFMKKNDFLKFIYEIINDTETEMPVQNVSVSESNETIIEIPEDTCDDITDDMGEVAEMMEEGNVENNE